MAGTNTTQIAATAFVRSEVSNSSGNFVTINTIEEITGDKTFSCKINLFDQSYANIETMNIGFAPNGENLSSRAVGINALYSHKYRNHQIGIGNKILYRDVRGQK